MKWLMLPLVVLMGFSNSGGKVKLDQFKGNVRIYGNLDVGGEINKGLVNQVQAATAAIGQLETTGFLGNLNVRGTLYQQLGQQWVGPIANNFGGSVINDIAFGNGVYIAVTTDNKVSRSTDFGATWSVPVNPLGGVQTISIAFGNGVFIVTGTNGLTSRSINNGVAWSAPIAIAMVSPNKIAFGNGVFVIVGSSGGVARIIRSTDLGLTWSGFLANPFTGVSVTSIDFGFGVFVAIAAVNHEIARSTDLGLNWSPLIANSFINPISSIRFGNGIFMVGGNGGVVSISLNLGQTWGALINTALVSAVQSISYVFGVFNLGDNSGNFVRSYDTGATFSGLITNPFGASIIMGMASSTINIVAVSATGLIATAGWNAVLSKYIEQPYTPVFTGFGVVTNINMTYTIVGNCLKVMGQFVPGVVTGVEARISLPNGLISDASLIPSIQLCGTYVIDSAAGAAGFPTVLIESGVGYVTIGDWTVAQSGLTKRLANNIFTNGIKVSIQFELPLSGYNT
jgi:hypothetical protein